MRISVYGTRGSFPVCRRDVVRYGGNTTCWAIESEGELIIIDGGSGIANLGRELLARFPEGRKLHICLTHPHWDHVLGLPFFSPLFSPLFSVTVHGADSEEKPLDGVLATQHQEASFPVRFRHLPASISFDRLKSGDTRKIGGVVVRTLQLNHPGFDLGYRFESPRGTFVFLSDLAPIVNNHLGAGMSEQAAAGAAAFERDYWASLVDFVAGADLVAHDTNFTDDEIQGHFHWGHSTPTHALELVAQHSAPPALILCHHDPAHTDPELDAIYRTTKARGREQGIDVLIAKEGGDFLL